ncbi:MAG: 4-(cytidine 5'-diphospho)-2-C-methyl-D-erythritol kinase [Clostridia bacterium]|nr:4-(cytidine 5'-diphospho)-2-C-methyl-D-erythritol kinase [Clostridia bacterium]
MRLERRAYAKINWMLSVTGRRDDGYHTLDMLTQRISLADTLTFETADRLTLEMTGLPISGDVGGNLVFRAARLLGGSSFGARISLLKEIPTGAGLGGGSSDAACALLALNELWDLRLPLERLMELALQLGADVPYFLQNEPMRLRGIGEIMTPFAPGRRKELVLLQPCEGLSTPEVYRLYDRLPAQAFSAEQAMQALSRDDLAALSAVGGNSLYPAALSLRPELREGLDQLRKEGAEYAAMTGSGSVVYGVFSDQKSADRACSALYERFGWARRAHTL